LKERTPYFIDKEATISPYKPEIPFKKSLNNVRVNALKSFGKSALSLLN
jgi:hypothetical protein